MALARCELEHPGAVCALCVSTLPQPTEGETHYLLVSLANKRAINRHLGAFVEFPIPGLDITCPAYVRPRNLAQLRWRRWGGGNFDVMFYLCSGSCAFVLSRALESHTSVVSMEIWPRPQPQPGPAG